ncbi:MAG: polysaccharide deacetylase family protein [Gemmataceae bacterium]|nr:polysaccharide deacetylase family protein [Gemmataceae bacterium]
MNRALTSPWRSDKVHPSDRSFDMNGLQTILSFDVEEHDRIEAAAHLQVDPAMKAHYAQRLTPSTMWLLDQLDNFGIKATFFVVGQIARTHPRLVKDIAQRGHEVGSHSWDHRRVHLHTRDSFRQDLRLSRDAIEQVTGQRVQGYRAPTFSIVTQNAWALDLLVEEGFAYDSSIFPVRHDRYGVPEAPRAPFRAAGFEHEILEIPPATLRFWRLNLPVGGGGYFRLFPLVLLRAALRQIDTGLKPPVAMLYFHPWEFDPQQERLPLGRLSSFRTYVGIGRSRARLMQLMSGLRYVRAAEVAKHLDQHWNVLPAYAVASEPLANEDIERAPDAVPNTGWEGQPRLAEASVI